MVLFIYIVIGLSALFNLFKLFLEYKSKNNIFPENVKDIYNEEEYAKWKKYSSKKVKISIIEEIVSIVFIYSLLIFNVFPLLDKVITINNQIIKDATTTLIFLTLDTFISIIFEAITTFGVEKEFGFTTLNVKSFIRDTIIKEILIFALIFVISIGVSASIDYFGIYSILIFSIVYTVFSLFLLSLIFKIVMKLFYKFTILEEGSLKEKINAYAKSQNFNVSNIYVMNASSKSKKLNAFFQGYGKNRRIVLYDTLIEAMSEEEIVSVLAHEMGHSFNKDGIKGIFQNLVYMYLIIVVIYFVITTNSLSEAFKFDSLSIPFGIYIAFNLISILSTILSIPLNYLSRKAEYKADSFASKTTTKDAIGNALKVLAKQNFANLTPNPFIVKLSYSHPTISQRLDNIDKSY